MKQGGSLMKASALLVLAGFVPTQLSYAADPRQMLLDAKAFFEEEEASRPHGLSAADLQANQASQMTAIETQQAIQDLQEPAFSLTTANGDVLKYLGDKLSEVKRPDGTRLSNIVTDAAGNILDADLRLADGSVQILQGGQVVGYMTPDGVQVIYQNGIIQKTVDPKGLETFYTYVRDAQGQVTETTLDGPTHIAKYGADQRIKEATRKSDSQHIYYSGGMIDRIVNADGSVLYFDRQAVSGGDIQLTPRGQGAGNSVYLDPAGNAYHFTAGAVSKIVLSDGSTMDNIVWNATDEVSDATLTEADGTRYLFRNKQLTTAYDAAGIVTNYTYTSGLIIAAKQGNTWEYLADGTPVKYTDLAGNQSWFYQQGTYKGLKEREKAYTGATYVYDYSGPAATPAVQRRELQSSQYLITTFDGQTVNAQSTNPSLRFDVTIPNDGSIDQGVVAAATYSTTKNLRLSLSAGTGSTYQFNGVTTPLGVTLNRGTAYRVEMRWESGRIGIYVYPAASTRPSTPTASIADRAWDPKFKVTATNVQAVLDSTSSGYFGRNSDVRDKSYAYVNGSPLLRFEYTPISASYRTINLKAIQTSTGGITRTLTFFQNTAGTWTFTKSDLNTSTNVTTNSSTTLAMSLSTSKTYLIEMRILSGKAELFVYEKGTAKPSSPTASMDAFNVYTKLEAYMVSGLSSGAQLLKNMTAQTYSSAAHGSIPLTDRVGLLSSGVFKKPAAPPAGSSPSDFQSIRYSAAGELKEVVLQDGAKLLFEQGLLKQAADAAGNLTSFQFTQSAMSNVLGLSIVQSDLTSTYAADGRLESIRTAGLTVHYQPDGSAHYIEKDDGTEIWDMVFDAAGNLVDAVIISPDGEERQYRAGKLVGIQRPDKSILYYANDKPIQMITPEKITYNFTYTPTAIEAAVLSGTALPDALTPVKMEYDLNYNLKKVTRQNQEVMSYLNNDLVQIAAPNEAAKVFSYTRDGSGAVTSYTVTQGNVVTTYDANNQPMRAVISPDANNPHTLEVSYAYGKMRQVKKNGAVTFKYTYEWGEDGDGRTVVEDIEEDRIKTYKDDQLLSSLERATSVLSSYEYAAGKVSRVKLTRYGRHLHTYDYAYSGTDTLVTDEQGTRRTYDAAQKLRFLEKEGMKSAYTYTTVAADPVIQQTVLPVTTLGTSSRSSGVNSWENWTANTTDQSLSIGSSGWVQYTVNLSQAGDVRVSFDTTSTWHVPSGYAFNFDLSVDGALKIDNYQSPGAKDVYRTNEILLTGLSQGQHTIRLHWTNDYYVAGQYDANLKFRNLAMRHEAVTVQPPRVIVEEALIERRLSDGSIAHYTAGRISRVDQADGRRLDGFVTAADGSVREARWYADAQDTVGAKVTFKDGRIDSVVDAAGKTHAFTYEADASGSVRATWVKRGAAILKYDAADDLRAVRIDGVMTPDEAKSAAVHSYVGGVGALSIDGDFNTAQSVYSSCGGCGGIGAFVTSQHGFEFSQPQNVTGVTFRMRIHAYAHGNYIRDYSGAYYVEVLRSGSWQIVPGTQVSFSGGDGDDSRDSGIVTLSGLTLDNVSAVRAYAYGHGNASGGEGSAGGDAHIYEIQFSLADLSMLDVASDAAGYTLSGAKGTIRFDAQGGLVTGDADYTAIQNELNGVMDTYAKNPFRNADLRILHEAFAATDTVTLQEYDGAGTMETQTKQDGSVTLFANNKPVEVLDRDGRTLIQYSYDAAGNPTRVYLKHARDSLPGEVLKARESIESQRADATRQLAQQRNLAYQSIQNNYAQQKLSLQSQLASLESSYAQTSSQSAKGKAAKAAKSAALSGQQTNIDQARAVLTQLYEMEADSYAALDAQVKALSDSIDADTATAVTGLATQEAQVKREILRQEISPVVYDAYRRVLGRDPDTGEYNYWISQIDYASGASLAESKTVSGANLTAALASHLNALPELSQRTSYVNAVKSAVAADVNAYLAMTDAQKTTFAAGLGLEAGDVIPLLSSDASAILSWLNTRSLHFGQSAFLALEAMLDAKGISYDRQILAKRAILVDILSGVITPFDDGDLVLSVFALNKVGKLYGLDLTGAHLAWEDLAAVIPATATAASPRMIAHINGNHFVLITAMGPDAITYVDMGKGKDKQNESITLTKTEFLKVWDGNVTLERSAYAAVSQRSGSAARALSKDETKEIRGAFLPLLFAAAWAAVKGVGVFLAGVGAWVTTSLLPTIGSVVGQIIQGVGSVLSGVGEALSYVGKGLFEAVKFAASTLGKVIASPFATQTSQSVIGGAVKASFGETLFKTAVTLGFSVATQKGLEVLGVNPAIANLASAFVSGGITGGFNAGFSAAGFIKGGVKAFALQGTQTVLQNAGVDSPMLNAISLAATPFIDGVVTGNIGGAALKVIQDLPTISVNYGLQKVGESIGLGPLVSQIASAPLAVTLGTALKGGAWAGQTILDSVRQSIGMGAVAYGLELAGQSHPVLGSLLSADIIRGASLVVGKFGLIERALAKMSDLVLGAVNVVGGIVQNVMAGVTSFSQEIQSKGLTQALQDNLNAFFGRSAQEAILAKGGVAAVLAQPRTQTTLTNGQTAYEAVIDVNHSLYFDAQNNLIGKKEMADIQIGEFGKNASGDRVRLMQGTAYATIDGVTIKADTAAAQVMNAEFKDASGQTLASASSKEVGQSIRLEVPADSNAGPKFWDAVVNLASTGASFSFSQGVAVAAEVVGGTSLESSSPNNTTLFALVNGIRNSETDPTKSPDYINNFESDIAGSSNGAYEEGRDFMKSAIYQKMLMSSLPDLDGALNQAKDIVRLYFESISPVMHFISTTKIIMDFDNRFRVSPADSTRPIVAMGYSGGFLPLVEAIRAQHYNTDTLVALGAATTGPLSIPFEDLPATHILNMISQGLFSDAFSAIIGHVSDIKDISALGIKRVVNVWGTKDVLANLGIGGKRDSIGGIKTYNIEIKGADHFDYMRRSGETDPVKEDFNLRVSDFVARLTLAGDDDQKILTFLQSEIGQSDSDGVWRFIP